MYKTSIHLRVTGDSNHEQRLQKLHMVLVFDVTCTYKRMTPQKVVSADTSADTLGTLVCPKTYMLSAQSSPVLFMAVCR